MTFSMLELSDQGDDREIAGSLVGVEILQLGDFCNKSVFNVVALPPPPHLLDLS